MIMILDDEPWFIEAYSTALEFSGFSVTVSRTEEEFFAALAECGNPEAVIIDVMLPGNWEAGLGTAHRLRQLQPNVPIVFLTNRDDIQSLAWEDAMTSALCKRDVGPVDLAAVLKRVTSRPSPSGGVAELDPT